MSLKNCLIGLDINSIYENFCFYDLFTKHHNSKKILLVVFRWKGTSFKCMIVLSLSLKENINYVYCLLPNGQGRARS